MTFTNLCGPALPYNFVGSLSKSIFGFVPSVGELATGFSCISHNGLLKFGMMGDDARMPEPKVFLDIYEDILNEVLYGAAHNVLASTKAKKESSWYKLYYDNYN